MINACLFGIYIYIYKDFQFYSHLSALRWNPNFLTKMGHIQMTITHLICVEKKFKIYVQIQI